MTAVVVFKLVLCCSQNLFHKELWFRAVTIGAFLPWLGPNIPALVFGRVDIDLDTCRRAMFMRGNFIIHQVRTVAHIVTLQDRYLKSLFSCFLKPGFA